MDSLSLWWVRVSVWMLVQSGGRAGREGSLVVVVAHLASTPPRGSCTLAACMQAGPWQLHRPPPAGQARGPKVPPGTSRHRRGRLISRPCSQRASSWVSQPLGGGCRCQCISDHEGSLSAIGTSHIPARDCWYIHGRRHGRGRVPSPPTHHQLGRPELSPSRSLLLSQAPRSSLSSPTPERVQAARCPGQQLAWANGRPEPT